MSNRLLNRTLNRTTTHHLVSFHGAEVVHLSSLARLRVPDLQIQLKELVSEVDEVGDLVAGAREFVGRQRARNHAASHLNEVAHHDVNARQKLLLVCALLLC